MLDNCTARLFNLEHSESVEFIIGDSETCPSPEKLPMPQAQWTLNCQNCNCGKYVEGRGVDLFNKIVRRNLEGVVAKRKTGTYATVSGWLKIKNPNYTQSERRHELFDKFKEKAATTKLPPVPKKPPLRTAPLAVTRGRKRKTL